ncbi:Uncharacterised protein [Mycobacteroides abscessus subsp. abscessus]|nr:Uncharacterised protein [Mycobacteroides abscessus subsp. abscessus]
MIILRCGNNDTISLPNLFRYNVDGFRYMILGSLIENW